MKRFLNREKSFGEIPLIQPADLLGEIAVQPQALVVFSPYDLKLVLSRVSVVPHSFQNLHFSSLQTIRINNNHLTLAGPAIGASVAAMLLEVLRAFGTCQIIAIGSCGSLDKNLRIGHFVIPESTLSDEGTSSHYPLRGKTVKPSPRILEDLKSGCKKQKHKWTAGKVWTTDAPFRETPQKIKKFQQKQAVAVDMELSALFKAGSFYGIEIGALLVVSDELFSLKWNPGHKSKIYKKAFTAALEIVLPLLNQLK